jgi:hypothetical protein
MREGILDFLAKSGKIVKCASSSCFVPITPNTPDRAMSAFGGRAGHYTPLSTDGDDASLLTRDEQVRGFGVGSTSGPRDLA